MASLTSNRVFGWGIFAFALYAILRNTVPLPTLAVLLNGVLFGMGFALLIAFARLIWVSIFGAGNSFDRANQYALGDAILWISVFIGLTSSVYLRTIGEAPSTTTELLIIQRYLAIFAAIVQITAPDFGKSIFYGRDRRVLLGSGLIGLLVAAIVVWLQT